VRLVLVALWLLNDVCTILFLSFENNMRQH
jgi:hypothetical protein